MIFGEKTILILEDDPDLSEMIQFQFRAKGYNAITAANGIEGLVKLKKIKPDLIILDLNMPKMGGIEFYYNICGSENKPQYPVMVMTARADMKKLFLELEVDGFMTKPIDLEQLFYEVEIILKREARQHDNLLGTKDEKTIFIVESDLNSYKHIDNVFHESGYKVHMERSGTTAIEKIMQDPPHMAMINLLVDDIPGDIIALKLRIMAKTMYVRSIVYILRDFTHHPAVMNKIGQKTGIVKFIEYNDAEELLGAVDKVFGKA